MLKPEIHKRVKELIELIHGYPREYGTLKDDLDFLRVCTKYLVFDLEAYRRELGGKRKD